MTSRKLQQTISRVTAILQSIVLNLSTLESESRQFGACFPTSVLRLRTELNGSRRDLLALMESPYETL